MADRHAQLAELGAEVVVLAPGTPAAAADLVARLAQPVRVLPDPSGQALDALGFRRVAGLIRRSGTLVVDRQGRLRYARRVTNPTASLVLDEVLEALRAAGG